MPELFNKTDPEMLSVFRMKTKNNKDKMDQMNCSGLQPYKYQNS